MFYTQLFTVLKRIADDRRDGQLPIHVRLWADEYYAGPKPLNCETLLGEIRSRNMSIVPILQDIAQIKTLYPMINGKYSRETVQQRYSSAVVLLHIQHISGYLIC